MTDEEIKSIYANDDPEDLAHLYFDTQRQVEKRKGLRILLLHALFFIVYLSLFLLFSKPSGILQILVFAGIALGVSAVHFWLHFYVFLLFFNKQREENEHMECIEKRIRFTSQRINEMSHLELCNTIAKRLWHYTEGLRDFHHGDPSAVVILWAALLYSVNDRFDDSYTAHSVIRSYFSTAPTSYSRHFEFGNGARSDAANQLNSFYQACIGSGFNTKTQIGVADLLSLVNNQISTSLSLNSFREAVASADNYVKFLYNQRTS